MAASYISLSELSPEVRALIDRLPTGDEIVIESPHGPVAILRPSEGHKAKTLSALIARIEERENELGHPLIMDEDYAQDMREILANRKPRDMSVWD